ncbi:MAG TPA: DUF711 family protein [Candidatus Bathyarchaeota archaeon]|nr:DUF711 family protein [Candidatus Bathyarchaeota archaeon]
MRIRALTLMVDAKFIKEFTENPHILEKAFKSCQNEMNIPIWSKRLAVNPVETSKLEQIAENFTDLGDVIDFYAVPLKLKSESEIGEVANILYRYNKLFVSIYGGLRELKLYKKLLEEIKSKFPYEIFIKVSFSIGRPIFTPYFPSAAAISGRKDLAAALLYVNDIIESLKNSKSLMETIKNCTLRAIELLKYLCKLLGFNGFGIDISISPWMNESVAKLIELYGNLKFNDPGTHYTILKLNELLKNVWGEVASCVGFNEIMLPYAEDKLLMNYGMAGSITAYDLLSLASVCVAGFDMIPLPKMSNTDLNNLLVDIYSILKMKAKCSGVRIIPTEAKPGETVNLGFIGDVPVLKLK